MKILCVSDIHLNDYFRYNKGKRTRLYQSLQLAEDIVRIGKEVGAEELDILGDLLDNSVNRPYVQHVLKNFLKIVCKGFKTVKYIVGQHDYDTKTDLISQEDTVISLFDFPNLIYAHKQIYEYNTKRGVVRVAMKNYEREHDLSWIDGKVDLLLSHYTLSTLFGQEIDESKFDLGIFGDIHKFQRIGKMISIGSPQQQSMKDQDIGTVVTYDLDSGVAEMIEIDPNHEKYLRFRYTEVKEDHGFSEDGLWFNIYHPTTFVNPDGKEINIPQLSDIVELVRTVSEQQELLDIYEEVVTGISGTDFVDFDVTPLGLEVRNYRSLEKIDLDFEKGDKILIHGHNGSGKTSIISALGFAFVGNDNWKGDIGDFGSTMTSKVTFLYGGHKYELCRGSRDFLCTDGGEPEDFGGKLKFNAAMFNMFPFLRYMDLMFHNVKRYELLSSIDSDRRMQLISKYFRLDYIDDANESARRLLERCNNEIGENQSFINVANEEIRKIKESIDSLTTKVTSNGGDTEESIFLSINTLIAQKQQADSYVLEKLKKDKAKAVLDNLKTLEEESKEALARITVTDKDLEDKKKSLEVVKENIKTNKTWKENFDKFTKELKDSLEEGKKCKVLLDSLKASKCTECGLDISGLPYTAEKIKTVSTERLEIGVKYKKAESDLQAIKFDQEVYVKRCSEYEKEESNIKTTIKLLETELNKKEFATNALNGISQKVENATKEYDKIVLPKFVEFTDENLRELQRLESLRVYYSEIKEHNEKLKSKEEEKKPKCDKVEILSARKVRLEKFISLTCRTGDIYQHMLGKLAEQFSNDNVRYSVVSYTSRNIPRLDLSVEYMATNKWRQYGKLSSGQKTVCDINFISNVVASGIVVFDEFLKHLDPEYLKECLETLSSMNLNFMLISSFADNVPFCNKKIHTTLLTGDITEVEIS